MNFDFTTEGRFALVHTHARVVNSAAVGTDKRDSASFRTLVDRRPGSGAILKS